MRDGIVVITGQMRSGTSAVAEVVHRLGIPVATRLYAPVPPVGRFEWEDTYLADTLVRWARLDAPQAPHWVRWFHDYFFQRRQHAERFFGAPAFGFKSPMLALLWPEVMKAAPGAVVLCTRRPEDQIAASEARALLPDVLEQGREINRKIAAAMPAVEARANRIVDYARLVREPAAEVAQIAAAVGVSDEERIAAAAACIKGPTSGPGVQ